MPEETQEVQVDPQETVEETQQETSEETQEETQEATQEGEEVEQEEPKLYKLKINGVDEEFTEEQLLQIASKSAGADKKFQEAAQERKRIGEVFEKLKQNPFEVLQKLGIDTLKLSEDYLKKIYALEEMPEEQKKLLEAQEQIKRLEEEREESKKKEEEKQIAAEAEEWQKKYDYEITTALEKSILPRTPNTIARVANYIHQGLKEGLEVPADKAVALVEEDIRLENQSVVSNMEMEKLAKHLGPDIIKKLKNYDLSKVTTPEEKNKVTEAIKSQGARKSKKQTWDEMKAELDEITGPI